MMTSEVWRTLVPYLAVSMAIGLWATTSGCGDSDEDWKPVRRAPRKSAQTTPQEAADELGSKEKKVAFSYSPVGKRDPFKSYIAMMLQDPNREKKRPKSPTEEYEIGQYQLTGLLSGTSQPRAVLQDPSGKGHIVKIGTRLGRNGGRITRISSNEIMVVEEFRAPTGERKRVPIKIELPKREIGLKGIPKGAGGTP
jgi:type IV pilus assembly protein PilP